MTKLAYLECPTGISGDMCLGAIADIGVPLNYMAEHLNRLGISEEYQIRIEKVYRNGQQATKVFVDLLMPPTAPVCSATDTHESTTGQYHSHVHSATECVTSATDGAWHSHAQDDHPHDHHHPDSPIHTQDAFHSSTPPLPFSSAQPAPN